MIELLGSDTCPSCKQAQMLLSKTPMPYKYVDVATINFEGEIPRLILEDKTELVGLGQINTYIKQCMREKGL
jgi:glutaredoxin